MTGHNTSNISGSPTVWRFRELTRAHRLALDASMSTSGVGELGQPFALFTLKSVGNGCMSTQRELAERLGVSPATLTASLKALERKGLIKRAADKEDMRCKRIELTDSGREITEKCGAAFTAVDDAMYAGFSPEELCALSSFFERMTENLRSIYQERKEV